MPGSSTMLMRSAGTSVIHGGWTKRCWPIGRGGKCSFQFSAQPSSARVCTASAGRGASGKSSRSASTNVSSSATGAAPAKCAMIRTSPATSSVCKPGAPLSSRKLSSGSASAGVAVTVSAVQVGMRGGIARGAGCAGASCVVRWALSVCGALCPLAHSTPPLRHEGVSGWAARLLGLRRPQTPNGQRPTTPAAPAPPRRLRRRQTLNRQRKTAPAQPAPSHPRRALGTIRPMSWLRIAHRGAAGTRPELTRAAFERALEIGVDMIELDVQLTRDRQLVVLHDLELGRTLQGEGAVREHNFDELRALDAGAWFALEYAGARVPSLAEVLDLTDGKAALNVEVKSPAPDWQPTASAVVDLLTARGRL